MGEGQLRRRDMAETLSPWTSLGGLFWEVEVRYKVEIATALEYGWGIEFTEPGVGLYLCYIY